MVVIVMDDDKDRSTVFEHIDGCDGGDVRRLVERPTTICGSRHVCVVLLEET
jgi:hypothetical protein